MFPIREQVKNLLIKHEGLRLKPYRCTSGKLTIGVGRNLEDNGIGKEEALLMLDNDIMNTVGELSATVPMFSSLGYARQAVLIDMCFALGLPSFLSFKKMLKAVSEFDFHTAGNEILESRWATQVGRRAYELSEMMKNGEWV